MSALRAAAAFLAPELQAEVERLLELEVTAGLLVAELAEARARAHRAQVLAGEHSSELARIRARLEDLVPAEMAIAKRDATFTGTGWIRITSRGRHRFDIERVQPGRITLRDADR